MNIDLVIALLLTLVLILLIYLAVRLNDTRYFLQDNHKKLEAYIRDQTNNLFSQLEIDRTLRDRLSLKKGLPYTKDWSASADFLKLIVDHCFDNKPSVIFECSSGLTTLMLARCCQLNGTGHVISLEHKADYAQKTRNELIKYDLVGMAEVIYAPLIHHEINDQSFQWYDTKDISEIKIEMLVIASPSGFIQKHSRYPDLPVLLNRLADQCVVFMDNEAGADEKEILTQWLADQPNSSHKFIKTDRGCSIFTINKRD